MGPSTESPEFEFWQRALAAVVAAVAFWAQLPATAISGLDPSYEAAFALARTHGLAWGPEILYTYGPLGFLQNAAYYSLGQSVLATAYQLFVVAALFLGITAALRCYRAPMPSLVGAFATTGIAVIIQGFRYPELAVLAVFAWASAVLMQHDPKRRTAWTTCLVLGAVAGFQLLMKLNSGLVIVAIALATSALLDWKAVGRHCATLTAFVVSIPIWWVLAGQQLGDLLIWVRSSADVVTGYSEAMSLFLTREAIPAGVLSLAWLGALCAAFVRGGPNIPRKWVVLAGLATAISAKVALGRFDVIHVSTLLGVIVVAMAISPPFRTRGPALVAAAVAVAYVLGIGVVIMRVEKAAQAPLRAGIRIGELALPGRFGEFVSQAKAHQRALYAVPDRFIHTIGSGTVHIDPYETSAIWAYDFAWHPAPVFQTFQANTPILDNLNGDSLAHGPDFVLSRLSSTSPATGIDGGDWTPGAVARLAVQESPRYTRNLLCNYTLSGTENGWALFTHTNPHCGPLIALSEASVHQNDAITVPVPSGPDIAVLVGIDLDRPIFDRLFQGTIAPLAIPTVVIDRVGYHLITRNAAEPFLVRSPGLVEGTNLQIGARTISVGRIPSLGWGDVTAKLRFYEMRVGP